MFTSKILQDRTIVIFLMGNDTSGVFIFLLYFLLLHFSFVLSLCIELDLFAISRSGLFLTFTFFLLVPYFPGEHSRKCMCGNCLAC